MLIAEIVTATGGGGTAAAQAVGFCAQTANVWQVIGYVVTIVKIVIPLALIILGMVDLGKAVVASDDKAINKSVTTLITRFIAAVVIFFIPTIVNTVFNLLTHVNDGNTDYDICVECVTNANGGECDGYANSALGIK